MLTPRAPAPGPCPDPMSQPSRFAPPTQLDALRTLLASYSEGDRTFQAQLHKSLQTLRQQALLELGSRLARTTTPRGLRSLILEATATFDWPEWDVHLMHMLQPEEDLGLFDEGCAALGGLCTPRALKWLQRLKELRRDPERQAVLDREIGLYHGELGLEEALACLGAGQGNPDLARLGARRLAVLLDSAQLPLLMEAFHQGDALTRRLALYLLAYLTEAASDALLLSLFQELRSELLGPRSEGPLGALPQDSLRETLDDVAGLLAARVEAGKLPLEETLPRLEEAFQASAGGEGLLIAYLRLVSWDDKARLDRILADPDIPRRARSVEILGAREEDRLVPFFLRAMNDPHPDVAQLAVRQFGKLPSGAPAMLNLFRSGHLDQMRLAIRFFGQNRIPSAAKPLVGLLSTDAPDELLVDAVKALGEICDPSAANALLNLLHDGKPLLLQVALAEALGRFRAPAASLGLLKKSEHIKVPHVLALSLEGALSAFPGFDRPFPAEQATALEHLVERCCDAREGDGQWIRAALAMEDLYVFDAELYRRLRDRFSDFLLSTRHRGAAEREAGDRVAEALRKLLQRAVNLGLLEEREAALRAQMEAFPAEGPGRMEVLTRMQETLSAPGLILGEDLAQALVDFLRAELARKGPDLPETLCLCDLAGKSGQGALVEPLRDLHAHAPGPEIRAGARGALLALGLAENEIERRGPIAQILLFEPNAFYRKRLMSAMEGRGPKVAAAATRVEAEAALAAGTVDLLITESHDEAGDLGPWIESGWEQRRYRYTLVSTSNHDLGTLAGKPWVIGRLYKPYPMDELLKALEG